MIKFFLFFITICIAISCRDNTPKGIIPKDKMMLVLWDYMEANVYSFEQLRDSMQEDSLVNAKMQSNIFKKYKVSRNEFENSYDYYSKHADVLKLMVDSIIARKQRVDTVNKFKEDVTPSQAL